MSIAALSLAQSPPLSVPLRFFLTAPLFLAAAALLLLWYGPELLLSRWLPGVLAAVHLVTLGFGAQVMAGAVQQLLPVLAGSPVPRPRLAAALIHLPLTAGTALLAAGFILGAPTALRAALALLGAGLLAFFLAAGVALARSRSAHATTVGMGVAVVALLVTAALGLHLLAGWALPGATLDRALTDLHAAWGLVGWMVLLVAAVAYTVVPMFQVTPDYPRLMQRALVPALALLLGAWSLLAAAGSPWRWAPALALAAGVSGFAVATLRLQQRRRRRLPDVTVDYWRLGQGALLGAVAVWLLHGLLPAWSARLELLTGVLLLMGFGLSVMSGMLYKIVPFLVWLHLNNRLQAAGQFQGQAPNMKQVIPELPARRQFRLHVGALALLAGACLWPALARPAAALWLASSGLLGWNLVAAARLYRRVLAEAERRQ